MQLYCIVLLQTMTWLSYASPSSTTDSNDHFQLQRRGISRQNAAIASAEPIGTRSRGRAAGGGGSPTSPVSPGKGLGLGQSSQGISKQGPAGSSMRGNQRQGIQASEKSRDRHGKASSKPTHEDAWAKFETKGGSSVHLSDHASTNAGGEEGWDKVPTGERRSRRIMSPKQASTSVVPDENNRNSHHTSAQGQRVRVWLKNTDARNPAEVEASGPGYRTVSHKISQSDGGVHRQYRAVSPSRPVTVRTNFKGSSDAFLEATNPGSPKYNRRVPADQITRMQNE